MIEITTAQCEEDDGTFLCVGGQSTKKKITRVAKMCDARRGSGGKRLDDGRTMVGIHGAQSYHTTQQCMTILKASAHKPAPADHGRMANDGKRLWEVEGTTHHRSRSRLFLTVRRGCFDKLWSSMVPYHLKFRNS